MISPEETMKAVNNVRDGIALYLKSELGMEDEVLTDAFRHLFDLQEISDRCRGEMNQIINTTKENHRALTMFLNAIQSKVLLFDTAGLEDSAMKLSLHLRHLDMRIAQLETKPFLSPDEFIRAAEKFYFEFMNTYVLKK